MKWESLQLADLFEVARGGSPRPIQKFITDSPDGLNWIMIGDATSGSKYIASTKKRIKPEGLAKTRMVQEGDFLLTNSMSFGRPFILKTSGCIHDGWLVLSPKSDSVFPDFFYYLLGSETLYREFTKRAAGAVVKNLNTSLVKQVRVPFPPLDEQKRIAAILDAADALRAKRREALAQLDTLLQSTFLEMFGDPVINPKGWNVGTLERLGRVVTGSTPPSKEPNMFDGDIPFITPGDLKDSWVESARTVTEAGASKSRTVEGGASLICCIGATIGKMGKAAARSAFNQQINAVTWGPLIDPDFGFEMMRFFKAKIANDGASTTLPILKKSLFEKIEVPAPPIKLQHRFATIVQSVEQQKSRLRTHLDELDTLFASLQARAFAGEL